MVAIYLSDNCIILIISYQGSLNEFKNQIRLKVCECISYQDLSKLIEKLEGFKDWNIILDDTINIKG